MKIAVDISQIAYEGTGVANYTRELVNNLLKYDKKNRYLIFGYSLRNKDSLYKFFSSLSSFSSNVEFRSFTLPQSLADFIGNGLHIIPLERLIGKVDIYHSSDWIQFPSSAKKITTVHDLIVYKYPQTSDKKIISTQKKRLFHVRRECQFILADSFSTKNDLMDILKIDENRIKVVYPGIGNYFKLVTSSFSAVTLKKYQIDNPFILAVGKNDPRKNLTRVIAAFKKSRIKAHLVIVSGTGWGERLMEDKNIRIITDMESRDLPALYSQASMLVYPSLYEGFGLPVIEAQKSGCPVITSQSGSLKEVAGDSALFVDPLSVDDISSKIHQLYKNEKLIKNLIEKGKVNAGRFSWEKSAKKIISIYESL